MATDTYGAEHGAEAAGMPQLEFSTFPNQIFWLVIALIAIYLILSRVALPADCCCFGRAFRCHHQ
jgi:F-type H+-transporting ATPase subunit b